MQGPSIAKSEYTVIDIGSRDGTPRLVRFHLPLRWPPVKPILTKSQITSVRSSQGFMWNPGMLITPIPSIKAN